MQNNSVRFVVCKRLFYHAQWRPSHPSTLMHAGTTFTLMQFHAHTPSEHTFDHHHHPGVLHWVYQSSAGQLVVVAVMLKSGIFNPQFAQWLQRVPSHPKTTSFNAHLLHPESLWPNRRSFFSLEGSLTTPPCTEGVHWLVMQEPIEVSVGQLALLQQQFGQTNRPLQSRNHRSIHAFVSRTSRFKHA